MKFKANKGSLFLHWPAGWTQYTVHRYTVHTHGAECSCLLSLIYWCHQRQLAPGSITVSVTSETTLCPPWQIGKWPPLCVILTTHLSPVTCPQQPQHHLQPPRPCHCVFFPRNPFPRQAKRGL